MMCNWYADWTYAEWEWLLLRLLVGMQNCSSQPRIETAVPCMAAMAAIHSCLMGTLSCYTPNRYESVVFGYWAKGTDEFDGSSPCIWFSNLLPIWEKGDLHIVIWLISRRPVDPDRYVWFFVSIYGFQLTFVRQTPHFWLDFLGGDLPHHHRFKPLEKGGCGKKTNHIKPHVVQ